MNLLAISFALPPYLYPQAIQIGRLISHISEHSSIHVGAVCGTFDPFKKGLDCYPDFDNRLAFRLTVPHKPFFSGLVHQLAIFGVPLYGRCPDEFRGWIPKAEHRLKQYLSESGFSADVLISFGQPMTDHLLGLRLKKHLNLPWIVHFSDPWADNLFNRGFFISNLLNKKMEREVIAEADQVIFTSQETLDLVMSKYPSGWRIKSKVLPHGYEAALYPEETVKKDPDCVIRYLGNFYSTRSPEPLFKGLAQIYQDSPEILTDLRIELVGTIPARMLNSAAYKSLPDNLVTMIRTQDYLKSLALMKDADLLLVIDAPDEISVFLPSKLVDYIGAGVPILGIVPPGTSAKLIERLGGCVANPDHVDKVAAALRQSIEMCRKRRTESPDLPWGDPEVRAGFQAEIVGKHFLDMIHEVVD